MECKTPQHGANLTGQGSGVPVCQESQVMCALFKEGVSLSLPTIMAPCMCLGTHSGGKAVCGPSLARTILLVSG